MRSLLNICGALLLITGLSTPREILAAPPTTPVVPAAWSIAAAVDYALAANPASEIALRRIEQAEQSFAQAQGASRPRVNLSSQYSQTDTPMYSFGNILNQGAFNETIDFNDPGRTDNLNITLGLQYTIYNGGRDKARQEMTEAQIQAMSAERLAVHQQLAFEVVRAYHVIIQAEEMIRVGEASLAAISSSLAVGKARYETGDLLEQDLLNLELQQARASDELVQSRHDLDLANQTFLNLLGLSPGPVKLAWPAEPPQAVPASLDPLKRSEVAALDALIAGAAADLRTAEGAALPTIDTFAQYQLDAGTVLEESGDSWQAGLRLNYDLYDGHRTDAGIAKAKSRLLEIQAEKEKLLLALRLDLQKAEIAHRQASERIELTKKMVSVAEASTRLSRVRFQEGVILASDLIDMEMRLTDAKARNAAAQTEHLIAIANLRRASGLDQVAAGE